jgi:hypothetical protein
MGQLFYLEAFRQRKNLDQLGRLRKLQMQQLQELRLRDPHAYLNGKKVPTTTHVAVNT